MDEDNNQEQREDQDFAKLALATLAGVLILGGAVYAAYRYSQKQAGNIVLPGGVTYLGPSPNPPAGGTQPPTAPLRFTAASNVDWKVYTGKIYPYTISYPSTLPLVIFPDDPMDSVALSWGNIPPQQNILLNMESIGKRDPSYTGKPKIEFVKNWYKYFSGLKGVSKAEPFTNTQGLKGYKASYLNWANQAPNVDVFFETPDESVMINLANGILDSNIFDRIIDSVKWGKTKTTAN